MAERLKEARIALGVSVETMAHHVGVTRQTLHSWETGQTSPRISDLPALEHALHVRGAWLVFGTGRGPR